MLLGHDAEHHGHRNTGPKNYREAVGGGHDQRVLFNYANWPKKNIFYLQRMCLLLPPLTCNVPKTMESHFLHSPYRSHFLSVPSSAFSACFWLVVAYKIVYYQPFKAIMYLMVFIFLPFDLMVQTIGLRPPMRSPP